MSTKQAITTGTIICAGAVKKAWKKEKSQHVAAKNVYQHKERVIF